MLAGLTLGRPLRGFIVFVFETPGIVLQPSFIWYEELAHVTRQFEQITDPSGAVAAPGATSETSLLLSFHFIVPPSENKSTTRDYWMETPSPAP